MAGAGGCLLRRFSATTGSLAAGGRDQQAAAAVTEPPVDAERTRRDAARHALRLADMTDRVD